MCDGDAHRVIRTVKPRQSDWASHARRSSMPTTIVCFILLLLAQTHTRITRADRLSTVECVCVCVWQAGILVFELGGTERVVHRRPVLARDWQWRLGPSCPAEGV
jgi:hypothetical protein